MSPQRVPGTQSGVQFTVEAFHAKIPTHKLIQRLSSRAFERGLPMVTELKDQPDVVALFRNLEYLTVSHGSLWSPCEISGLHVDFTRTGQGRDKDLTRTAGGLNEEQPAKWPISSPPPVHFQSSPHGVHRRI